MNDETVPPPPTEAPGISAEQQFAEQWFAEQEFAVVRAKQDFMLCRMQRRVSESSELREQ